MQGTDNIFSIMPPGIAWSAITDMVSEYTEDAAEQFYFNI